MPKIPAMQDKYSHLDVERAAQAYWTARDVRELVVHHQGQG